MFAIEKYNPEGPYILSGLAFRLLGDGVILKWARSQDKWWRRAALVSTVAPNVRSRGGKGDVPRTLKACRLFADDHEDTIEKALSWALCELIVHDAGAVRDFITEHEARLASRVKREVGNRLSTGVKSQRRRAN